MKNDSMTDVAYGLMLKKKKVRSFYELWDSVCKELEIEEEKKVDLISYFYTNLILDGRFVNVGENTWDLRERLQFEKVHIDMNDIYADEEEIEVEKEELEIEKTPDEDFDEEFEEEKEDLDDDMDEESHKNPLSYDYGTDED